MSKDVFKPTVFKRGYMGIGENKSRYGAGLPKTKKYLTWFAMMQRCYSENSLKRKPTYKGCSVCEEWWDFQKFCDWFDKNYYEVNEEVMCLDKDILSKGNKIYSPETCVFVPQSINKLLTLRDRFRGDLPLGVRKNGNNFSAFCNLENKSIYIGTFKTEIEAEFAYKTFKNEVMKSMAIKYMDSIPINLYNVLIDYKMD